MTETNELTIEKETSEEQCVDPRMAAVGLQSHFGFEARRLRPRDEALQEDLIQEMSYLVLRCRTPMPLAYFKTVARLRALNYLKYEDRRRKVPSCIPLAQRSTELSEDITEEEQLERDQEDERRMLLDIFKKASRIHKAPVPEVDGASETQKESA